MCSDAFVGVAEDKKTELAVLVAASLGLNDTTGELFWWFDILAETRFGWDAGEVTRGLLLPDGPETYYHWFGPIVHWPNHAFGLQITMHTSNSLVVGKYYSHRCDALQLAQ